MNKAELIAVIAGKSGCTKTDAEMILNNALKAIAERVAKGEKVAIVGFGSFEARRRAAREGRNPQTGERLSVPETVTPVFSAGKDFRELVREAMAEKPTRKSPDSSQTENEPGD